MISGVQAQAWNVAEQGGNGDADRCERGGRPGDSSRASSRSKKTGTGLGHPQSALEGRDKTKILVSADQGVPSTAFNHVGKGASGTAVVARDSRWRQLVFSAV
jgi:hypothetical protein